MPTIQSGATLAEAVHILRIRRPPAATDPPPVAHKTHRVTIHADGDQWQQLALADGDAIGVGEIDAAVIHGDLHIWPAHLSPYRPSRP